MSEWVTTCNESPGWLSRDETGSESSRWCLTVLWSAAEPERIGETAFLDDLRQARVLGRGEATLEDPGERVKFVRQRPGRLIPTAALKGEGLSRRQCLVQAREDGVSIQNCGRAAMLVDGVASSEAQVKEGQLVAIRDQLVLYCSRQAPLARLRHFDTQQSPDFGLADAHGIVGEHRAIWELREQLAFAAQSDQHVLILGESGSGKELAARALHRLSRRCKNALVARNAATFPATLIDAELFGNAANYPNAGMPARNGIIGQVDGSTLFLDELAELPSEMQAHLLRVLDRGGEYQRLGDAQVRHSDFRLVAATNRDPTDLRIDILGRLTLQVQLPALVDRLVDIPLLVRHLLLRASEAAPQLRERFFVDSADGPQPRIDPDLIERLVRYQFTYNIRELDSLLWKAIADSPRNFVMLTRGLREELESRGSTTVTALSSGKEPSAQEIIEGLNRNAHHIARTAEALGLSSRYALYRLMRKHGIVIERANDTAASS
jgi:DNA-binding NtrC family response regulator